MAQLENSLSTASGDQASSLSFSSNGNPVILAENQQQEEQQQPPAKKKRNQPGMPDPEAEVVALSPKSLMATNRFVCEICGKGFQRDQNLQLHRRGHNLPWRLKQRGPKDTVRKRVYVCPETSCVHHDPRRALGDLTGIKKHFCRKHGEKKWKCERCSKKYAVQSDWKAHLKTCGTREYRCDCGTLFSRRDSFVTHRAFCDALAQESAKVQSLSVGSPPATSTLALSPVMSINQSSEMQENAIGVTSSLSSAGCTTSSTSNGNIIYDNSMFAPLSGLSPSMSQPQSSFPTLITSIEPPPALSLSSFYQYPGNASSPLFPAPEHDHHHHHRHYPAPPPQPTMSATALLQKAAQMGAAASGSSLLCGFGLSVASPAPPSHDYDELHHKEVKQENGSSSVADGLGLGPMIGDPSGLFGSKPMTLDFLGLGMGPGNSSPGAFPAYLTSMGSPLDVVAAFGGGNRSEVKGSWDGQAAQRKPNETLL